MVLGHEGVGIVEDLGPDCKFLNKGDRVGWGYEDGSCGHCNECLEGAETYCPERVFYGDRSLNNNSFATGAVRHESFLFKIPDNMSDEAAAPLQCGGATVFRALQINDMRPTETVGIMGVGGLGHLAIQFAAKMGCRVVVLSGSDRKKDDALKLGAHEFIATKDKAELKTSRPIDRLLVTTSAQPDWQQLLPILAPRAVVFPLSIASGDFAIPYMPLLIHGITVQGSVVAPRSVHRKMLEFAALHGIEPVTQTFPMTEQGIQEAMDKLDKGEVHYRAVLKA